MMKRSVIFIIFICIPLLQWAALLNDTIDYTQQLGEVVITSKYIRQSNNGNIELRMQGNPIVKGKTTADVLNFIPGVYVKDNTLSINNRENTFLYIGNRKITIDELRAIAPSMIKKIIVMPQAETYYGANATGGVIKIILKETSGLIGSGIAKCNNDGGGFVDITPSTSLLFKYGNHSIYNNLIAGYGNYTIRNKRTDCYEDYTLRTQTDRKRKEFLFSDNLGYRYDINPRSSIDIYGGFLFDKTNIDYSSETSNTILGIDTDGYIRKYNIGGEFDYSFGENSRHQLSIKADYSYSDEDNDQSYETVNQKESLMEENVGFFSFDSNIQLLLGHSNHLKAGMSYTHLNDKNMKSGIEDDLLAQVEHRKFSLKGRDVSPWIEYNKTIKNNLYLRAGIRYYNGTMTYSDKLTDINFDIPYHGFFPNVFLRLRFNEERASSLSLSYRYTYSLPNYGYYNPTAQYSSYNLYSVGNQNLEKETFHRIEVNYNLNKEWSMTFQNIIGHDIIRIMTYPDSNAEDVYYTIPENVGKSFTSSLLVKWNGKLFNWWKTNNNLSMTYQRESMPHQVVNCPFIRLTSSNQYDMAKNLGVNLSFEINSENRHLGYTVGGSYCIDASIYYSMLKNALSVNLGLLNIIHNNKKVTTQSKGVEMVREDVSRQSRIALTVIWNFNSREKIKSQKMRSVKALTKESPIL